MQFTCCWNIIGSWVSRCNAFIISLKCRIILISTSFSKNRSIRILLPKRKGEKVPMIPHTNHCEPWLTSGSPQMRRINNRQNAGIAIISQSSTRLIKISIKLKSSTILQHFSDAAYLRLDIRIFCISWRNKKTISSLFDWSNEMVSLIIAAQPLMSKVQHNLMGTKAPFTHTRAVPRLEHGDNALFSKHQPITKC